MSKSAYIAVFPDGKWSPVVTADGGLVIYKLKSDAPLALADSLDEVLGDEDSDKPLQNVQAVIADVQLQELLDEYVGDPAGPHVRPLRDDESDFFGLQEET